MHGPAVPMLPRESVGWRWLTPECRRCRHRGGVKLASLPPAVRLAAFAHRLRCRECWNSSVHVFLGVYVQSTGGQPWANYRRIAFESDVAVRPVRDRKRGRKERSW